MLNRQITFGGDLIPAIIASAPHIIRPARKTTVTVIPGSNRESVKMEDAWESYDQPYTLFVGDGSEDSIQDALSEIARRLYKTGYQVLEDDYEPDIFRLAYFNGPFDVENRYTRAGKFNISFRCRPERYLNSGASPVNVNSGDVLVNPTNYNALPLIRIAGSGSGTLTVGGVVMSFTGLVDYLIVDSDQMDVYRLRTENKNDLMTGDFPVLLPGNNTVAFDGGIQSVTITPRYWVI